MHCQCEAGSLQAHKKRPPKVRKKAKKKKKRKKKRKRKKKKRKRKRKKKKKTSRCAVWRRDGGARARDF